MQAITRHRGPDDSGEFLDHSVGLAFNRLSILDLAGGHQPMPNEDQTVWVVFNGEIYNFRELRADLRQRGHRFRTTSDTEIIVHAWEEFGESCVHKLRGMFAFFIWDSRRHILFGARDRLGIKPLYYFRDNRQFAFASELKSLLEIPGITREIHPEALGEFLRHRYVIAPDTLFTQIKKLPPGHTIAITNGAVRIKKYWDIPLRPATPVKEPQAVQQLDALLEEIMRSHLVADVPLGAFLSGGLDSSCVVALMSRLGVSDIKTFSVGYDSPESELDYARVVAQHFRTNHHELRLTAEQFRDSLARIVWYMDEPVGDTASIPCYQLANFAREKVTVALSGEGSDEVFGGYPIYRRMIGFERANRLPLAKQLGGFLPRLMGDTKIKKYAEMLGAPLESRYGGVSKLFPPSQVERIYPFSIQGSDQVAVAYRECSHLGPLERMMYIDTKTWLPDDLLVKADRMTMGNSLELRVPFLDHRLVEFGAALPARYKVRGRTSKYLLKRWAEGVLPKKIVYRTKRGFPVPLKSWFRSNLAGFARETILAHDGIARTFFSTSEIEHVFKQHQIEDRSEQIYSLIVLQEWYRQFACSSASPASSYQAPDYAASCVES